MINWDKESFPTDPPELILTKHWATDSEHNGKAQVLVQNK